MITNKINANLVLNEPEGGIRFGTDALLLADFALGSIKKGTCIDLGTGSGVLPLLLLGAGSKASFVGLEVQKEYAEVAAQNAANNNFQGRFSVINRNAEDFKETFESGRADFVITNPPYMRSDCGFNNQNGALDIARREILGGASLFCKAAGWALKSGGSFFAVYRPDRLVNLFCAMRDASIEPKRLRAVVAHSGATPSLVLVEGRKDGKEGLTYESNLYLYKDTTHTDQTDEIKSIYEKF